MIPYNSVSKEIFCRLCISALKWQQRESVFQWNIWIVEISINEIGLFKSEGIKYLAVEDTNSYGVYNLNNESVLEGNSIKREAENSYNSTWGEH